MQRFACQARLRAEKRVTIAGRIINIKIAVKGKVTVPNRKYPSTHGGERPGAGRPAIPGLRRVYVTVDEETHELGKAIGLGKFSEGVRIAVKAYARAPQAKK